ncbi:MAG TPA: DUF2283 domain-containing protein [archaeon]|nr:DUF2283 domain-containing protein [archaeon]
MARKKVNVSYDFEEDILHFFSGDKVKDSIEIDDFVFDISHDEHIVGWQINNASKFLSSYYGSRITKEFLSNIKDGYISNILSKELVFVKIVFFAMKNKVREEMELVSNIPQIAVA